MGVMALSIPLPIYLGRVKMALAKELHDKVLYADADMNKADWIPPVGVRWRSTGRRSRAPPT